MLNWAQQFNIFCFLDNQQYAIAPHTHECLLAAGVHSSIKGTVIDFKKNAAFFETNNWIFGHLSFELLHDQYNIKSHKAGGIGFPDCFFFKPQIVVYIKDNYLTIEADQAEAVYHQITTWVFEKGAQATDIALQQRLSKESYINTIRQLQQHILRGDCYEINYCLEFFAQPALLHPVQVFQNLMHLSPNPFSAFYKIEDAYLICASPERFLTKQGTQLIAQPIKGTARRSTDTAEDARLKKDFAGKQQRAS